MNNNQTVQCLVKVNSMLCHNQELHSTLSMHHLELMPDSYKLKQTFHFENDRKVLKRD